MAEIIIGGIVILMIFIVGISVSQINGNIKKLVKIQTELLERTSGPVARTGDRFDPVTGKPL